MLGAIIGDIVGSVYEWNNIKTKIFPLFSKHCFFTDDTVMTIAVADALLNGGATEDFIKSMKKFGRQYPDAGYGGRFNGWLNSESQKPYNSYGNGAAMRVAPCAWYADSLEEAENLAKISSAVTHNHPEGIKGAQATTAAIYLARTGKDMKYIKKYVQDIYEYNLSRTLDEIRLYYSFNETCQETVPEAIIAFLESNDFEDAIRNAISLGGDSDTLAAITGSIAEAYYGVRSVFVINAFQFLDETLSSVINAWLDAGKSYRAIVQKHDWKTKEFIEQRTIKAYLNLSETQYALIRHGLKPEQMEDKWFAYFEDNRLCFHSSWTGKKVYEAVIKRTNSHYIISEIIINNDDNSDSSTDNEKITQFIYLIYRGLLGMNVELPDYKGDAIDIFRVWVDFSDMSLVKDDFEYYTEDDRGFRIVQPENE